MAETMRDRSLDLCSFFSVTSADVMTVSSRETVISFVIKSPKVKCVKILPVA